MSAISIPFLLVNDGNRTEILYSAGLFLACGPANHIVRVTNAARPLVVEPGKAVIDSVVSGSLREALQVIADQYERFAPLHSKEDDLNPRFGCELPAKVFLEFIVVEKGRVQATGTPYVLASISNDRKLEEKFTGELVSLLGPKLSATQASHPK